MQVHPQPERRGAPEPEMLDEICPECGQHNLQRRVGRYGPFVGCSGYPECKYIKKDPAKELGIVCPQCREGEIVEKHTRFGMFYGCDRYPECDFSTSNPPVKDHPCPECGSLLVQRPKSIRCWNCGAELDKDFHVTKSGDPEAEAAARAAKALGPRRAREREEDRGQAHLGEDGDDGQENVPRPRSAWRNRRTSPPHRPTTPRRRRGSWPASPRRSRRSGARAAATFKDLLRHPNFSRLLAAQTVSSLGDWIGFSAVAILALRLGGGGNAGAYAVAGVMVARMLPSVLFGPVAGALVDGSNRKRIMIIADMSRAVLYAIVPFVGPLLVALPRVVRDRVDVAAVDARPRRQPAEPRCRGDSSRTRTRSASSRPTRRCRWGRSCSRCRVRRLRPGPYLGTHPESLALLAGRFTFLFSASMLSRCLPAPGIAPIETARALAHRQGHPGRHPVPPRELARVGDDAGDRRRVLRRRSGARPRDRSSRRTRSRGTRRDGACCRPRSASAWASGMAGSNKVVQVMERE